MRVIRFTPFKMEPYSALEALGIPAIAAGPRRNARMIREGKPEAVIAMWDGSSTGTVDMIAKARKSGLGIFVFRTDGSAHESVPMQLDMFREVATT